jgi:hypothetical protein
MALSQIQRVGEKNPKEREVVIAYGARRFTNQESNQGASVRKLLGLCASLRHFESFLRFNEFVVKIDCNALLYLRDGFKQS